MKKLGYIDFYVSEWHANNYPKWLRRVSDALGEEYVVKYVWAEQDKSPVDGRTTDEWCEAYGAERCASIAEVCEKSDYVFILAPDDPEKHLLYAREAFPFGKPTYIDKTFAPSTAEAEAIYALSAQYGTPFFSTSPLRYATELSGLSPKNFAVYCGGAEFPGYVVHLLEMIIKVMGTGAAVTAAEHTGTAYRAQLAFADGRTASLEYEPKNTFVIEPDGERIPVKSEFFFHLITDVVNFFREGTVPFSSAETMDLMRLRDEILARIGE